MATPVDVEGSVFTGDLDRLEALADTLNCPVKFLVRHAIRLGIADLETDVNVDGDTLADLEAAA